jgi:hypothetical protein
VKPFQNLNRIDVFETLEKAKLFIPEHKHQPLTVLLFLDNLLATKEYLFSYFIYENIIECFKCAPQYRFEFDFEFYYWADEEYKRVIFLIEEKFKILKDTPNKEMDDFREERRIAEATAEEERIAFAIESDRWLAQHLGKGETESQTIQSSDETLPPKPESLTLEDLKKLISKFNEGIEIPMTIVVNHFKSLTTRKSKNGKPFLNEEQLILFLRKAFLDHDFPKQILNAGYGQKLRIIKIFREFYDIAVNDHGEKHKLKPYIKLVSENFEDWDYDSVEALFKPKRKKKIKS